MTTPKPPGAHAAPSTTLEAPLAPEPAPLPMTSTPKQRADVAEVARMLRADQPGREDLEADESEEANDDTSPSPDVFPHASENDRDGFGIPEWFRMPKNGFPGDVAPGTTVIFVRFPTHITGDIKRGERQCACRPLTTQLERFARTKAANGNGYDLAEEYTRAMLCVVDGSQAQHFAKGEGSINHFWSEIGPKARELLIGIYNKLHRLEAKERTAFLESCVAVRTVG